MTNQSVLEEVVRKFISHTKIDKRVVSLWPYDFQDKLANKIATILGPFIRTEYSKLMQERKE